MELSLTRRSLVTLLTTAIILEFSLPLLAKECIGNNLLPMFGCDESYKAHAEDLEFINQVKRSGISKEIAFHRALKLGWDAQKSGDLSTAIKRFNQAWLLDRESYQALWAFGAWAGTQGKTESSLTFFRKAAAKKPKDVAFYSDLGRTESALAAQKKDETLYSEAEAAFKKAEEIDPKYALTYVQWAIMCFYRGRYADSWSLVKKAEAIDMKLLPPNFVKDLNAKMARPKS